MKRIYYWAASIVLLVLGTGACSLITGDYDTSLSDASGDSDTDTDTDADTDTYTPQITVYVNSGEMINGDDVDFEEVLVDGADGEMGDWISILIHNTGNGDLQIQTDPSIAGPHADSFQINTGSFNPFLTPGSDSSFEVRFDPLAGGINEAMLTISSDDPDAEYFILDFFGNGIDNELPLVMDPGLTVTNLDTTSAEVSWQAASDNGTPQADLEYMLYFSLAPNLISLSDIQANGIEAMPSWVPGATSGVASSLSPSTEYCYNVVVRDASDNMAIYDMACLPSGSDIYIFSTSLFAGDEFGGVFSDGVAMCDNASSSFPSLPGGNMMPLLSMQSMPMYDYPSMYGLPTNRPVVGPTGTLIGNDWADLFDGSIANSLSTAGVLGGGTGTYWTGTNSDGSLATFNCTNWTSGANADYGTMGDNNAADGTWLDNAYVACNSSMRFLCVAWN